MTKGLNEYLFRIDIFQKTSGSQCIACMFPINCLFIRGIFRV